MLYDYFFFSAPQLKRDPLGGYRQFVNASTFSRAGYANERPTLVSASRGEAQVAP